MCMRSYCEGLRKRNIVKAQSTILGNVQAFILKNECNSEQGARYVVIKKVDFHTICIQATITSALVCGGIRSITLHFYQAKNVHVYLSSRWWNHSSINVFSSIGWKSCMCGHLESTCTLFLLQCWSTLYSTWFTWCLNDALSIHREDKYLSSSKQA